LPRNAIVKTFGGISVDIPTSRTGILTDFLSEAELAAELGCFERTLARWRGLRIGPPFAMKGREPIYETQAARAWLAAGGTKGAASSKKTRKG
jgi:hypothetical protein